jgi:DNA-binding CsgD family transcriptional regulator
MSEMTPQLPGPATITDREHEAWHWVAGGKTNGEIALILGCCEATVKKHLQRLYPKIGVDTRTAAAIAYLQASSGPGKAPDPPLTSDL